MKKFPRWLLPVIVLVSVFSIASFALFWFGKRDNDIVLNNGTNVQVAGRARLEWQRIMRYAYELKFSGEENYAKVQKDLSTSIATFDQAVNALKDGGELNLGPAGVFEVEPNSLSGPSADVVDQIAAIWSPINGELKKAIQRAAPNQNDIDRAFASVNGADGAISGMTSRALGLISVGSFAATTRLANLQRIAIGLGVLSLATLIWLYSRQLGKVEALKKETDEILQTVPAGLFLLDQKFRIGAQYSTHLEKVLGEKNIGGKGFFETLGRMTNADTIEVARDYLNLLFGDQVDENLVHDVNPLDRLDAVIPNESGRPEKRHLGFGFRRVLDGKKLSHLLVTVTDITEQVQLREQVGKLEKQVDQADGQTLDMITGALSVDPKTLSERLQRYQQLIDEANSKLKESGRGHSAYRQLVDEVFRPLHTLKGETAALGLKSIAIGAEAAEAELVQLRNKPELNGNDFLAVAMRLDDLYARLGKLNQLQKKLADAFARDASVTNIAPAYVTGARPVVSAKPAAQPVVQNFQAAPRIDPATAAPTPVRAPSFDFNLIQQACLRTAEKLGKRVLVQAKGFDQVEVPAHVKQPLTDVLVQLVRNALAHGVEAPALRTQKGKPAAGTLSVSWQAIEDGYELSFRDDGDGLNFDNIRARAVQLGRMGAEQAAALDPRQLAGLIFEPGFSTAQKSNDSAGQGVGLDVVMAAVKRVGGKVAVGTQPGQYTQFRVRFPAKAVA